jgi:hypothetical protein
LGVGIHWGQKWEQVKDDLSIYARRSDIKGTSHAIIALKAGASVSSSAVFSCSTFGNELDSLLSYLIEGSSANTMARLPDEAVLNWN